MKYKQCWFSFLPGKGDKATHVALQVPVGLVLAFFWSLQYT